MLKNENSDDSVFCKKMDSRLILDFNLDLEDVSRLIDILNDPDQPQPTTSLCRICELSFPIIVPDCPHHRTHYNPQHPTQQQPTQQQPSKLNTLAPVPPPLPVAKKPLPHVDDYENPEAAKARRKRMKIYRTKRHWGKRFTYACRQEASYKKPRVSGRFIQINPAFKSM
ncbi:MAG: CCT domain-containing protein [Gammaproteobacteria bacterium]|nr:CCT domain-containing protein [Gammaproteobacteria bacterium]